MVGADLPGWSRFEEAYAEPDAFAPDGETRATDPLLLYFTSGTTAKPKLVLHTHQSYPVGHLSTMYWIGLREGDVHWNISSPGWAKHAWSSFFAPWNAGATVFGYDYARFEPRRALDTIVRCGVTTLCAPPTVWRMLVGEDLGAWPRRAARGRGRGRAAQSRGDRARAARVGPHDSRRLRADRDHGAGRQLRPASRSSPARWAGRSRATASCC